MKTVSVPNWFFEHPDYYGSSDDYRNGYDNEYNETIDDISEEEEE